MGEITSADFDRRKFIRNAGLLIGGSAMAFPALHSFASGSAKGTSGVVQAFSEKFHLSEISTIPNFCTHEHWGSITSIGMAPLQGGFRCDTTMGATPLTPTSIWDLILDPYQNGWMHAAHSDVAYGVAPSTPVNYAQLWKTSPQETLKKFKEQNNTLLMTGGFQCTRRGILELYGIDIAKFDLEGWKKVDSMISKNYDNIFSWYKRAMKKAHFSELIRPVHPEFYFQEESSASKLEEAGFTRTVMRIDPLLDLWQEQSERRDLLAKAMGVDPADAKSWRSFIAQLFELAAKNNAVGIKQLQAYRRNLNYLPRTDEEVIFRGKLDKENVTKFQDWVVHECCKQAHERNWIHQVHVGTNNINESSPMPLQSLALRYPKMSIVMIHCWPFLKEAGWLAKFVPNLFIDTCWLPVLSPEFLREGLNMWLNYVPAHKIMLGHDSTHVEMATGSSLFTREILAETLGAQQKSLKLSDASTRVFAADMLQNNAVRLYKYGKEVK